jgi:plasmid stability protein
MMASLTINVDETIIKRARIRALEQGTSVNAVLNEYLRIYVGEDTARDAVNALVELARESCADSGNQGRTWSRDELHDR